MKIYSFPRPSHGILIASHQMRRLTLVTIAACIPQILFRRNTSPLDLATGITSTSFQLDSFPSTANHGYQHRRLRATLQHCIGVWHRHAWSQITGGHCTGSPSPTPLIAMSIARSHRNKSTFRIVFPYAI